MQINHQIVLIKHRVPFQRKRKKSLEQISSSKSTKVNDNKVESSSDELKTSDLIKDVLHDSVENFVKESKISLNNKLSDEVGLNETDMTKVRVNEECVGHTTSSSSEKVFKVDNNNKDQSLGSENLTEEKSDCGHQTSYTAIESAISTSKNNKKNKQISHDKKDPSCNEANRSKKDSS